MKTREEKINAIVADAKENIENYEEIHEAYEYNCEQYPENKEDENYLEQAISDFLGQKEDEEINEMYEALILKPMNTLEILKTRKEEIIEATLDILPQALSGDRVNRAFYFEVDEETEEVKVTWFPYTGQIQTSDNCFYTIPSHETPDPENYGCNTIEEINFEDPENGFREFIEAEIDQYIIELESNSL